MITRFITIAAVGLLLAADGPQDKAATEQKKLEGTWAAKSIENGGEQVLGDTVKELKLVFAGNKISVKGDGPDLDKYAKMTFKIDPSTTPKLIDVTISAGDDKGTVLEGIYQVSDDELKLCFRIIGKERPDEFKTKDNLPIALAVFKREKP
jgi:uncharacterized protein (TIGR03067 family)